MTRRASFGSLQRVAAPRYTVVTAKVLAILVTANVVSLFVVPWQQTSQGTGRVTAFSPQEREQFLKAPLAARIDHWHVQEGDRVEEGQVLVELADNDPEFVRRLKLEQTAAQSKLDATSISMESIQQQIDALISVQGLTKREANAQIRMAENKIKAAKQKELAAVAGLRAASANDTRKRELAEKGLTSQRNVELAEQGLAKAQSEVFGAKAEVAGAQSELLAKQADLERKTADIDVKIAKERANLQKTRGDEAGATANLVKTETKVSRQEQMVVRAPRAGTIARIVAKQGGEYLKAGDALALLVPETQEQAVEIWVDGNDVPLIHPGREVRLQFEGWPAVQFSGWPSVAVGTFGGIVRFVDATAESDGRFRVVITQGTHTWPESQYLRQGARVNAWILLNRVTIGYEMWRNLNGFPPKANKPRGKDTKAQGPKS